MTNSWKDIPLWSWIGRLNIVKMDILPKEIYRFNAISIEISRAFSTDLEQIIFIIVWKHKRPWVAKTILKKKNRIRGITCLISDYTISSVQSLSHVWLFVTPWTAMHQVSLSITNSWNLVKLMSIELMMPSNNLTLCCPLLLLPSIFSSIRVFSHESVVHIK